MSEAIKAAQDARGEAVKRMAAAVQGSYNPNIDRAVNARIGVLAVKSDLSALMRILIEKGLIDEEELWKACATMMEGEALTQQRESAKYDIERAEGQVRRKKR